MVLSVVVGRKDTHESLRSDHFQPSRSSVDGEYAMKAPVERGVTLQKRPSLPRPSPSISPDGGSVFRNLDLDLGSNPVDAGDFVGRLRRAELCVEAMDLTLQQNHPIVH